MNQPQFLNNYNVLISNIKQSITENEIINHITSNSNIKLNSLVFLQDTIKYNSEMKKAKISLYSKEDVLELKNLLNFTEFKGSEWMVQETIPKAEFINSKTLFFDNINFTSGKEYEKFFEAFGKIKYLELKHNYGGEYLGKGILVYENLEISILAEVIENIKKLKPGCNVEKYVDNYISNSDLTIYIKNFPKEWNTKEIVESKVINIIKNYNIKRKVINEFIKESYYSLITFEKKEDKLEAVEEFNKIPGLYVTNYKTKKDRYFEVKNNLMDKNNIKSIFLKNLKEDVTEEDIKKVVERYGKIVSIFINKEKKLGSIKYETFEDCCEILKYKNEDKDLINLFTIRNQMNNNITFFLERIQREQIKKSKLNLQAILFQNSFNSQIMNPLPMDSKPKTNEFNTLEEIKSNLELFKSLKTDAKQQKLGNLVYPIVDKFLTDKTLNSKITGILIDFEILSLNEIIELIENEEKAKELIDEAVELLNNED